MNSSNQPKLKKMRKFLSNTLLSISGFFLYVASLLSFINDSSIASARWWGVLGFSISALIILIAGLAINNFKNWKKFTGVVFLSSSAVTAFLILTFMCMLMTDELRSMFKPETINFFTNYISGSFVVIGLALLGLFLIKSSKPNVK